MLKKFFTGSPATKAEEMGLPPDYFHTEAAYHGSHGKVFVTNRRLGLVNQEVNFVFAGRQLPPDLDLFIMSYIWEQAKARGFIPHKLSMYGFDAEAIILSEIDEQQPSQVFRTVRFMKPGEKQQ